MAAPASTLTPGPAYPLGATPGDGGTHFAVFAGAAERVELCLFDAPGGERRIALPACTDGVWHGFAPGVSAGQRYGYRVAGPYDPRRGLRFNPHKLLLDPHARAIDGALTWDDCLYGYSASNAELDLSFDDRDSAPFVPRGVVVDEGFDWDGDRLPRVPWTHTVIYEAHLRGLTQQHPELPPALRGRAAALGHPRVIEHLQRLGITTLELLPVHAWVDDRALCERGRVNYWGYNTLGFFAPEPRYLGSGSGAELKAAIRALHRAGIEVVLDVVYNHTCEGSELGPTLSLRGFDNAAYYRLDPAEPRRYLNYTGCGNTLNCAHPRVIQLVLDSLRHWSQHYHVDGFRLDLGTTLGRDETYSRGAALFDAIRQDPELAPLKWITEPWDVGPDGYQLGNHPPPFAEWNDRFRDDVRRYWAGDAGVRGALAARLQGSAEIFDRDGRTPRASVNFVTAHDGFTLEDLVSYSHKHNEANGEGNRDGTDANYSRNWGVEGPTAEVLVRARRATVKRALLATLFTSHGTPMLLAGDECGRTQHGNNNAYCQDSALSWFDWHLLREPAGEQLCQFLAHLIRLRRELGTLRASHFLHGQQLLAPGIADVQWFNERGALAQVEDWREEPHSLCLRRAARVGDVLEVTLVLTNNSELERVCLLPPPSLPWRLRIDTARETLAGDELVSGETRIVAPCSLQLLSARVPGR